MPPKFAASTFWRDYEATECTWYSAVPTMHQILLRSPIPKPLPMIRFIRSCSSALSPTAFHELEKVFGAPVVEAYGPWIRLRSDCAGQRRPALCSRSSSHADTPAMTEAAHQMTSNPLPPAARKPSSVGLPQGIELAILDDSDKRVEEGEVCSASRHLDPADRRSPRRKRHEGLPRESRGEQVGVHPGRLVPHGRSRQARQRGLCVRDAPG